MVSIPVGFENFFNGSNQRSLACHCDEHIVRAESALNEFGFKTIGRA